LFLEKNVNEKEEKQNEIYVALEQGKNSLFNYYFITNSSFSTA